jgi:hypothetical protein
VDKLFVLVPDKGRPLTRREFLQRLALKKPPFSLACWPLFALLACQSAFAFEAGWAKVPITPPFTTPLAGFVKRFSKPSTGVHDPLFARAIVVNGDGKKIAIVGADLLLINPELRDEIDRRLSSLRLSSLLLYATHTHSGIGGYWDNLITETLGMGWYEQRIFDFLVERLVTAVRQAHDNMMPAKVGSASAVYQGLAVNRRHRDATVASEIRVLRFDDRLGRPRAAIVNFAAHPTVLGPENRRVSADYPGVVSTELEKRFAVALFAPGAGADLSPRRIRQGDMYASAHAYGAKLAGLAADLLDRAHTTERGAVASRSIEITLPQATLAGLAGRSLAFFLDPIFRRFFPAKTRLQAIGLNNEVLTGWPGEVGSELQQALNHESGTAHKANRWIFSQANDHIGYIQTEREYMRGGYESELSFYGPSLGSELLKHMLDTVQKLSENP